MYIQKPQSHPIVQAKHLPITYEYSLESEDNAGNSLTDIIEANSLVEAYTKVLEILKMINEKTTTKFEISTISRMID